MTRNTTDLFVVARLRTLLGKSILCLHLSFLMLLLALPPLYAANLSTPNLSTPNLPILDLPTSTPATDALVVHIVFNSFFELQTLASELDVWEVHHEEKSGHGFVVALIPRTMVATLQQAGYHLEVDSLKSALLTWRPVVSAHQNAGIPGFPCYRTVEETYNSLQDLATTHPTLARWVDIGDSWDKVTAGGADGYDLQALVLTNQALPGPKPIFFLMAAIHAREYTTAETATRFAESLVQRYGFDADVTWLLDTTEIHIVAQANPDGRKQAERVVLWRKNTNSDGCPNENPSFSYYGVDLNRNSTFKWGACEGFGCSSANTCVDTFRGDAPASEPEVQALQSYMATLFPDRRGEADTDAAPSDTPGLMISLHSYSELILYPWGWRATPSPNQTELATLGRKFGYFTGYQVCQAGEPGCIYQTDGTTDDWAYGELGVAAYTFELGTAFFQQCTVFEEEMVDNTLAALFYAAKSASRPYQLPAGPETLSITAELTNVIPITGVVPITNVVPITTLVTSMERNAALAIAPLASTSLVTEVGPILTVTAIANDTRYNSNGWGTEPTQVISATRLTISTASWLTATQVYTMSAVDGLFDSGVEPVQLRLQLAAGPPVRYYLLLESQDRDGNWGVPSAAFATISSPTAIVEEQEPTVQQIYLPLIAR